ncbi:unnamed protein product [Vitrella brassicaformis CCMP3155]|uniref:Uncharacterized protein n=1 Tax=Vitrella brassicaformis (strain CCMP3155) TaxID=1169540 RepID=A0A0G4ELS7_VITBC|nr:unnamed protein product [Vitrella brassicaformis CCMP3155]|eukprot:CEL97974.1 unnamed protein product [Vitrella brassicaformis CCMP3155]
MRLSINFWGFYYTSNIPEQWQGVFDCIFAAFFAILGVVLFSVGVSLTTRAAALNPAADFEALGRVCTITHIESSAKLIRVPEDHTTMPAYMKTHSLPGDRGNVRCDVNYKYSFTAGDGTAEYTSWIETKSQSGLCPPAPALLHLETFERGDVVDCWRIRDGKGKVADSYRCGNKPHCYKIFNPVQEIKDQKSDGTVFMIVGAVFFAVGLASLLCVRYWGFLLQLVTGWIRTDRRDD